MMSKLLKKIGIICITTVLSLTCSFAYATSKDSPELDKTVTIETETEIIKVNGEIKSPPTDDTTNNALVALGVLNACMIAVYFKMSIKDAE